jgi:hypothetical protein
LGILTYACKALPQVIHWVLFVLSAPPERSDARVPFVVTPQAIASAGNAECRIATNEIGLVENDLHRSPRLGTFHFTDEWPQQVERQEPL